ncbi:MAG: AAA family ATPase [Candidatus Pacebacteria bacterium]|nr:AAA family ATPase [Candidatus Paceibacterota bacterium]
MNRGLVIGKFYPFHKGHEYLIEMARTQSDQLTVIVCDHVDQTIPGSVRAEWIRQVFPDVHVRTVPDVVASDDSVGWARYTVQVLGFVPERVFTSEGYGEAYATAMGSTHIMVDHARVQVPISATMIRGDVWKHATHLRPQVRTHFLRRVAIVGAESTGTTTLAQDLAKRFTTVWVPEVGRYYSEGKMFGHAKDAWTADELAWIGRAQADLEDALALQAHRVIFADTNPFATELWHERLVGGTNEDARAVSDTRRYDLHIVTDVGIPFVQDGTREGGEARLLMHERFLEELKSRNVPYLLVQGTCDERLRQATRAVRAIVHEPYGWSRINRCPDAWYCTSATEHAPI